MSNVYVNAMFESLQSNKSRVYCYELFDLVIKVSLSISATFINLIFVILITERCTINCCCVFAKFSVHVQLSFL